ncbi:hypothetical protein AQUCO_00600102v1 [Aquilegia coerulea]|uniref:Uncharacterized protein n=1 Tax=Aquilegia coerulea TaxID=218851 RepID=A0A2G5EN00_AQUCA|nr:hypothetical protein AQUCO_00600102v1 [Aquilegia coerulea]
MSMKYFIILHHLKSFIATRTFSSKRPISYQRLFPSSSPISKDFLEYVTNLSFVHTSESNTHLPLSPPI